MLAKWSLILLPQQIMVCIINRCFWVALFSGYMVTIAGELALLQQGKPSIFLANIAAKTIS